VEDANKTCFFYVAKYDLAIYAIKVFEISTKHSYTCVVQDPMVKYEKKNYYYY